ncbi:MAG: hypothetical protein AUK48_10150 [Oscillatoriales cyanobacterium CG2_30_44_21]|nr:MAG: hypothetical protein AUK48_10150 [Oscillatoriales cyanobacterium CG2_30_44_21]
MIQRLALTSNPRIIMKALRSNAFIIILGNHSNLLQNLQLGNWLNRSMGDSEARNKAKKYSWRQVLRRLNHEIN